MILVNTAYIAGKELEMLGLVKGSTIQSVNMGKDIGQAFKSLVGGELKSYNDPWELVESDDITTDPEYAYHQARLTAAA